MRRRLIAAILMAGALLAPALALAEPTTVYVTRHGEKGAGKDPELTTQGQARAAMLATLLGKVGIRQVYSTATLRTQQTAGPLASKAGVAVQTYDPAKPEAVIAKIKATPGPTLLVGHSNTVPELVKLLGGAPGTPIGDDEFDRLYQVTIGADGTVSTVLLTSIAAQ
ncbi:histidine phosphatase family protein [Massilia sp. CF038]|uniref:SixA phosphatase family protein n=1 Tax=Massilia sp. CF038 TaxID=1881045 RepID=UPI000917FAE9|nr:phosphoglycerate mutase family protein [Massilia sp. CF038]SHG66655.1 Histidine phosphatase superfamily (branch 1) [Massilia sp. CF038]